MFITFEGCEGSGKSTQAQLLFEYLDSKYPGDVILTKQPGGDSNICRKIRQILLDSQNTDLDNMAEFFLFMADRFHHLTSLIIPALDSGKIVICDRYEQSSTAYQVYGKQVISPYTYNQFRKLFPIKHPGLIIFINIDPAISLPRTLIRDKECLNERRFENEAIEFHKRVYNGYQFCLNGRNVRRINGDDTIDNIQTQVREHVDEYINMIKRIRGIDWNEFKRCITGNDKQFITDNLLSS